MKFRLAYRLLFLVCFQLISFFVFSQTIGGTRPIDDYDGDGIINSVDLDDDSDGVPDSEEYCSSSITLPATNTTAGITEQAVPAGWVISNSSPDIATTAYSIYGSWISTCTGTVPKPPNGHNSWVNFYSNTQEAFKTTLSGLVVGKTYILKVYYAKFGATAALGKITTKLGTTIIDDYRPSAGCGWETRYISFTATATAQDLQFQNTGLASPMQNASISVSSDALYEVCDTDNDGLPNQFDLDSDGDGCPDAKEAGVTGTLRNGDMKNGANGGVVTTSVSTAGAIAGLANSYGANGFADGVETVAESGVINYTSTYANYALSSAANVCSGLDTDGDGVVDLTDLDDDNDGILDEVETAWCKPLTASTIIPVGKTYGVTAASFGSYLPAVTAGLDATTCMSPGQVTTLTYEFGKTVNNPIIGFYGVDYAKEEWFDLNDNPVKLRILDASVPTSVSNNILTVSTNPLSGTNTAATSAMGRVQVYGNVTGLKVKHTWLLTSQNCDNHGFSFLEPTECLGGPNPDTDGDGVINSLDLDSDGDGCFDAIEAGVLSSTSTGKVTGTFGSNGFANSIETVAENGIYNSVYSYSYAIYNKVNACLDSDGDGVKDLFDLDDDNDGILDTIEQSTCANAPTYTFSNIDGSATGALAYNAAFPAWMRHSFTESEGGFKFTFDAPVSDIAFEFASIYQDDRVGDFSVKLADGTVLNGIDFDLSTTYGPTASIWTPQPNNVNNFTGNFSKFTGAPFNTGTPYFKTTNLTSGTAQSWGIVRLKNIAGANTVGIAEVSFKIIGGSATSGTGGLAIYNSCLSYLDTDNDGIPNTLDLDADGDECPDAKEANIQTSLSSGAIKNGTIGSLTTTTVANAIAGTAGNYGANGFANELETATESGIYSGSYSYGNATNRLINGCLDSDGDTVTDAFDLDDDNDGVLDVMEMQLCNSSALITPTSASSSPVYGGSNATRTIDGSGFTGSGLAALASAPAALENAWLLKEPETTGFIEYNLSPNTNVGGVVLWAPDAYNYGGGDGPVKDFTVEITYNNGQVFTTQIYTTLQPNSSGALSGAQVFSFPRSFANATKIKLNISAGWYDQNNNSIGQISTVGQTVPGAYNMFLGEFRVLCGDVDIDTDNDGTPNRLDLDSDGDGCPDAVESGTTFITSSGIAGATRLSATTIPAPYSANGFATGLETAAGNGIYKGNYNYTNALYNTINGCTDTDLDGIPDQLDIDDDNDGLTDTHECDPTPKKVLFAGSTENASNSMRSNLFAEFKNNLGFGATIVESNIIENATVPGGFYDGYDMIIFGGAAFNAIHTNHWTALETAIKNKTSKSFIIQSDNCCVLSNRQGLMDLLNNVFGTNYTTIGDASAWTETYPLNTTNSYAANFPATLKGSVYKPVFNVAAEDILYRSPAATGAALAGMKQIPGTPYKNQFVAWFVDGSMTQTWTAPDDWYGMNENKIATSFNSAFSTNSPLNCDTDNDGIPNHLDLDSDGDGCTDAKEAGVTGILNSGSVKNGLYGVVKTTTTLNDAIAAGPYGNNGLADALEIASENGLVNFTSKYSPYAVSKNLSICADTDLDGVFDMTDIDDDNDGVLDADESPLCFYTASEWLSGNRSEIMVSTSLSMGASYKNPEKLLDGDNGTATTNYAVNFLASTTAARTVYAFKMPMPVALKRIYVGYVNANTHFNTGTVIRIEGSNDNTTWSTLGNGYATVNAVPDITGTTNYNTFTVEDVNINKYLYYRIYWVSGGGVNASGIANEVYFKTPSNYIVSANPKSDCTRDTDGDGLFNHLDLDSDGDGCSDAIEAESSIIATSVTLAPTGADGNNNGLLNVYEGSTAGTTNYTSKYEPAALSKNIAACADTDGDGIADMIDLDDDNDGILDATESPDCFYTENDWHFGNRPDIKVSSELTMSSPQNQPQKLVDGKNSGVSYDVRMVSTTASVNALGSGRQVYKFNMNIPVKLSKVYLGYTGIYSHFNDGTKLILRGSNDGTTWTNLSGTSGTPEVTYDATINTSSATETSTIYPYPATTQYATSANIFSVTQNADKYQYYDIYWVSGGGINATGYANEVYFDVASNYIPSAHPKIDCTNDTDGDGILNHRDLDSDGDGCPDAKEAGITATLTSATVTNLAGATIASGTTSSTIQNAIVAGTGTSTFGNNGFANSLETSSESGLYNGTYDYSYASNKVVNTCLDSDGDGVPDVLDLDDDNDGVLDIVECPVPGKQPLVSRFDISSGASKIVNLNGFPEELWVDIWSLDNNFSLQVNGTNITNVSELNFAPMSSATVYAVPFTDVVRANGTAIYPLGAVWNYPNASQYPLIRVKINKNGYSKIYGYDFVNGTGNYQELLLVNAAYQKLPINQIGDNTVVFDQDNTSAPSFLNAEFNTFNSAGFCDTDGDGLENRLDLDSDGDGCSDAYEAKTTTSTTANFQYANNLSYGSNGFLNTLETITDNGIYNGYYPYDFAINSTIKSCLDSDGDGVPDVNDLDDDNDGILDAVESPTCFYTLKELAIPAAVSSDLLPYDATATYALSNSIDGLISTYSAFKSGQFLAGKEILKYTANGLIDITSFTLDLDFRAISTDAGSTFRFQGSADNVLWDNLNTAAVSSLTYTPPATLVLTNNLQAGKKYKYFRLLGIAGTSNFGGVANATFNLASSNRSSANPKLTCVNDLDGDGIPNHLDLDSDGDACPDAKEAGVIGTLTTGSVVNLANLNAAAGTATSTTNNVANAVAVGNYSANGFADALETGTESGNYSGTYNYDYAINKLLNACTDTDSDGVSDLFDIDDDNDGIVDAVESPTCFYNSLELSNPISISSELLPNSTNVITRAIDGDAATSASFTVNQNWIAKEIFKVVAISQIPISNLEIDVPSGWSFSNTVTTNTFKLQGSTDNFIWTDLSATMTSSLSAATLSISNTLAPNNKFKYFRVIGVGGVSYYAGASEIRLVVSSNYIQSQFTKPTCLTGRNDADLIPNHLDLDSDGDGCSDALEAGTTTSTTANFVFTGSPSDFGANGFYNSLEKTNAESNLYKGVYTYYYADNALYNACTDTDGDGISDLIDIDDDNDGILDAVESPTCFYNTVELSQPITVSTELLPHSTNLIGRAIDANAATFSSFDPSQNWIGMELFKVEALFPIPVSSLDLDLVSWALSSVAGNTFKLQGSGDNFAWTDLSTAQYSTATSGTYSLQNTIAPTNKYKYYRIIGVAGVSNYGGVTEIRFNIANSFVQSQYTKTTCLTGRSDGDLIPNYLDLDSDGDGCSDALETGTTSSSIANFKFTGTSTDFGANGFYNTLEKISSESNLYKGVYTYDYATNASYNSCTDTDGDGVPDLIDLDNDNDGVLDAVESPTCFYTIDELIYPSSVSSELTQYTASYAIENSIDGIGTTASAFATGQDWVGKEIFKFTAKNYIAISGMSFDLVNWALSSATGSTFKLQGSGDNMFWTDLSSPTYSSATTGTFTISNTLAATSKYKYYRLVGVAGTSSYGGVYEAKFTFSSSASSSANPKPTCTNDTDGDGKLNHNDLDSDGDGCPDAVEAGTTAITTSGVASAAKLTTSVIPGIYGANGFSNSLETASESGLYTGTYTYNYAINATINACADSDGDGVPDVSDLDDDNDGVLDTNEQINCFTSGIDLNTLTYNGSSINAKTANSLTTAGGDVWKSSYSNENLKLPISLKFKHNSTTGYEMFGLLPAATAQTPATWTDGGYKFYPQNSTVYGYFTTSWDFNQAISPTDELSIDISSTGYVTAAINGVIKKAFQGVVSDYKLALSSYRASSLTGVILTDATRPAILNCTDLDSDNDGIKNRLDLDSDGDGCPDAVEAGTTAIFTSGVASSAKLTTSIIPAPYGANGFANGLEKVTESGLYTGTYTYALAIDASQNACKDTDGDGVPDVLDIDDDNDGVLDSIENGPFGCAVSPACVTNASLSATASATGTPPTGWTNFANGGSVDINQGSWVNSYGPQATLSSVLFPASNASTFFIYGMSKGGNGSVGGWAPYGEAFQQTLNCLTIGQTYYLSFRGAFTHSQGIANAVAYETTPTAARFVLLRDGTQVSQAPDQLLQATQKTVTLSFVATATTHTIAIAHTNDLATDLSLMVIEAGSGYLCTSAAPSSNELLDTDGDGIPNRLDLDSDGDGCPDAKESGVNGTLNSGSVKNGTGGLVTSTSTIANAIAAGPYGNNGLANGVETATESGVVTYTSTYAANALVKDLVAPTISVQPLNRTVFVGTAIVLTTIAGTPPANKTLTYQWYKAGVAITGATSATYTITSSATTANVDDYYCAVGFVNSCLTTNTNTINVTVLSNPVGLTACQDANAPLSVTKTGTNSVTYQWKKAGVSLVNGAKIAGATTTSLTLTNLALADAGAYTLVATDANNVAITSLAGTITITNNTKYVLPTSYSTCATTSTINLSSSVLTSTAGATSTKWQRSIDGGNIWTDITSGVDAGITYTNFTTATLGITAATTTASATLNGYQYRIATANTTCTNYSNVETITINSAPAITTQPSNSVLCTVYATSFTAAATGSNILYQWQTRPAGNGSWTNITGSNASSLDAGVVYSNYATATLNLSASPAAENNNQYQVVVSNSCGTVTSTTAVLNPTVATPTISGGNVSVCEGTAVSLTASSSTASPTYQWYLSGSAIGGATNATYNPTASGSYSVITNATGYCSSGTASATVTINPLPTVTIAQGAVLTLTSGGGIDLTATASPTATYSYTWYNNTTSVSGPSSSNVYSVATAGSYTVKATNTITNCFAISAASVITVLPSPSVNGSSSICSGGSVAMSFALATGQTIQWESSLDGTNWTAINNATNANYTATPTNLTNASITIYYHAVVNGTAPTGTTNAIVVTVNPLPTANISNSASGTTLCAGTEAILTASSGATSATYQWYNNNSIITGATASTYTATASGNYSFIVTDGTTSCAASSITSTVTVVSPPAAPNLTATSKIICINTTADLTVYQPIALTGISYEWHSAANTLSSTLVANPTTVGTAGTYYLYAKNNSAACYSSPSVGFDLSIQSVGSATLTSASSPTYTVGDITIALNESTSNPTYSLRWYSSLTGGVALSSPVLPSSLYAGTTNYYVEQYDGNESFCTSNPRQLAIVTVKPLAPSITNITYCQNATAVALTATPAIGGTLNWYGTAATGGTSTTTATIPATGTATNTSYYVSQTVNGVESERATLTVSINAAPNSPSVISGTFSVISTNSYTYSVTAVANTTYQWTLPSFMSGSSSSNSITALVNAAGSDYINVIAVNANGCSSPASVSSVISAAQFVAPPPTITNSAYTIVDPAIPSNTSSQVTGASGATLNFYTSNAVGASSTSAQSMPTTEGVYTYYVSQTINGVESVLVPYTVTIKPVQPIVADITYCQNEVAAQLTATGTALKWYTVSTGGTSSSTATPSTGTATNTTYYVTQTVNGVESDRTALLVTINPTPATPSPITGSTTTATNSSELYSVINDVTATSYVWTLPNTWFGISTINDITATIGLSAGQITVKALNGNCASPAATLTVAILNVTNPPLTTDVIFVTGSTPSNILTNTTALITGAASSTLNFYTSNAAGTASTTTQPTPTEPGVYTYYVSQTSSIGVESILVPYTITVKPIAPAINTNAGIVGNTINYCKGATASPLTATVSNGGVLKWYTEAIGGFPSSIIPTVFTSVVGTTNYYISQIVNGVESDRALIVVTVNDLPSAITATASQPTCSITSGTILVTSPLGTGFTYSVDGSSYTATTLFNTLPSGSYLVTAKNANGCISNPTTVTINPAVIPPLTPLTSTVQPTCSVRTGTINIISTGLSSDSYSIDGGLSYQSSKIFTSVAPGTYSVTTLNASGCVSGATTAVINAAPPIPSQPTISAIPSGVICEGTSVTMTSSVSSGNQWYKDGVLIAGAINQTYSPNVSGNYTVIVTNASGCISLQSAAENITFNNLPTPIIAGGATLAFNNCTTTIITLTASNTSAASGNTYQWYLNGNSINVSGNSISYDANQAGNYSVVITNNGCSATSSISKLISAPSVNAANTAFCAGGNSIISGVNTGFVNPVYQWQISSDNGLTWANASGLSTNLNYTSTQSGKYQLQVTDGGLTSTSCPIIVTVFTNPTASITVSPSTAVCAGSTIGLAANATSGTAPYTYQWSLASSNDIANATASSYATGIAGSYEVKVTDANGCSVIAAPSTIDFNTVPSAPTVVITNPTCSVTTGTISITAPLGAGYTYSIDGVNYTNTTGLFTGVAPGATYNVTAKSTSGCISSATTATIAAALVLPSQPGVISGPTSVAANSLNTYSVSPVAGATSYTWTIPGVWTGVSITNAITIKVDASSGSISVSANSATCTGPARSLAITAISTVPDVNVTNINVPVTGSLTTNDLVPNGTTYGQPGNNPANPTGATITVNANGSYTFTSTTPGKYIYYVPVCAPGQSSNCPLTPLEITVLDPAATNNQPVANYDIVITPVNTATTVNILSNDKTGNNGTSLNPSSVTVPVQPAHGSVVVNADGTLTYTPFSNYVGTDSVIYSVCDNSPTPICQTSVVYFTISPVAVAKTLAADDFASVGGSSNGITATGNVLTNDKNTAGASLTATLVTGPSASQGTLVFNADGSYVFTPAAGFSGPVDIVYTACTGATPPVCATATLHILVNIITVDTDGDGVPDNIDLDNDNDGILDSVEFAACTPSSSTCDTDGDGIPNNLDLDSDGDGINDAIESGGIDLNGDGKVDGGVDASGVPLSANGGLTPADADGDGKKNPYDVDSDGDGIPDSVEKGAGLIPVDTDGDGTPDYLDTDSDGDGILDSIEKGAGSTPVDTDGDGVPDYKDLDSDGDGIPDSIEKGSSATPVDTDGDGVPDYKDLDSDGDGIPDSIEKGSGSTPVDTDGDGVPDYKDLDSDNDGIPDSIEKGAGATPVDTDGDGVPDYQDVDSDGDGIPDSIEKGAGATPVDTDGDGVPDYQDVDSDGDGIPDSIEKGAGATPVDTDGDGVPDYKDLDSDNDGIPDSIEKGSGATPVDTDGDGVPDYQDLDSDGDGIPDSIEKGAGVTPVDTDGDGVPDYKDLDSDNDGIPDSIEKGTGATPVDTDGDGVPDYKDLDSDNDGISDSIEKGSGATPVDTDGDGVPDYQDLDSDGDGIPDSIEKGSGSTPVDTDGDGVPDYKDLDSDNDGILDSIEKGSGSTPVDTDGDGVPDYKDLDSDNDGIPDSIEKGSGSTPVDTDGDGVPDYKDLDSDNDGIPDSIEKGSGSTPVDTDGDGIPDYKDVDSDGDGILDSIEKGSGSTPVDTDGDGVPDYKDLDSDNDGILDSIEKGAGSTPVDTDGDGVPDYQDLDSDNDGILDSIEKGSGATPVDTDGDGVPDYKDLDSDNDGILDSIEKGSGATPVDTDGDGVPDYKDLDSDNDGIPDSIEKGTGSTPVDTDGDGVPDYLDLDSDNDGILDSIEKGSGSTPVDTDGDGVPDYKDLDSDNDGIPDSIEKGSGSTPVDTDGDGIPDYLDLDSDNDGILDSIEKGADGNKPVDTDGDGVPDYKDLDSDNDGIPDSIEKGADGNKPVDTDGDGVPDYRDLDSDNDGIPDSIEKGSNGNKPVDTDGDGIPDYLDLDSDNDGIPDSIEKGSDGNKPVDTDGDGVPDYRDLDSDNDGIPDSIEKGADGNKPVDTDGDGTPDYRDLDSDNDGIPDTIEKGADGNKPVDTDGDGIPDYRDLDSDNDGILDSIEKGADGNKPVDTDGDGIPDYRDLDSDADGVTDADEKRDGTNPIDPCSLKLQSQTMQPSDAWMKADCNGDKVPNGEVLIVTKYVSKPVVQVDGSMQIKYTVALRNPRPDSVKTITIKDDLTKVFLSPINFTVTGTKSTGSLIKTSTYDGRGTIDLVTNLSSIAGYGADSVMIEVTIIPNGFSGDIDNIADVEATTKWGAVKRQSIDTVRSAGRLTGSGVANRFTIPKEKIIIPEAFSPNGDGFNDYFEIIHPSSTTISLAVYNRWGNVVYVNSDYQNDWRGKGKGNFLGQELPEGTYYYIINATEKFTKKVSNFAGFLNLKR